MPECLAAVAPAVEGNIEGAGRHPTCRGELIALLFQGAAQGGSLTQPPGRGQERVGQGAAGGEQVTPTLAQTLRVERKELRKELGIGSAQQALHPGLVERDVTLAGQGVPVALAPGKGEGAAVACEARRGKLHPGITVAEAHGRLPADPEEQLAEGVAQHRLAGAVRGQDEVDPPRRRVEGEHRVLKGSITTQRKAGQPHGRSALRQAGEQQVARLAQQLGRQVPFSGPHGRMVRT